MGKLKDIYNMRMAGHSLIEVIVSTIIILTAFLLFSVTFGQLLSARRTVPETKLLMGLTSFKTENGAIDTAIIHDIYGQANTTILNENVYSLPYQEVRITDRNSDKVVLRYFVHDDSTNASSLFQ